MKISDVKNELLERVQPAFEKHNFKLNKRSNDFSRSNDLITQIVDFYFVRKSSYVKIRPEIRIKVKAIDKIYSAITEKENRPFRTLGNHLFEIVRFLDTGQETGRSNVHDWLVENYDDIEKLTEIIPEYLDETILPYFEENSSVAKVDYLLNKHPREQSIHNYLYPLRANLAIIAAKLNNNPNYDRLVSIYEEELRDAAEDYKKEFETLKEELLVIED